MKDYQEGPEWSKKQHFEEWIRYIDKIKNGAEIEKRIYHLMKLDYSIHYHAWTQAEMLELMATLKQKFQFPFEVELVLENRGEVIIVLRKNS